MKHHFITEESKKNLAMVLASLKVDIKELIMMQHEARSMEALHE
ncbi:hypothetical protein [Mesobacillus zeae]|nr:hypothetical protein [Mesobacillus zeae]